MSATPIWSPIRPGRLWPSTVISVAPPTPNSSSASSAGWPPTPMAATAVGGRGWRITGLTPPASTSALPATWRALGSVRSTPRALTLPPQEIEQQFPDHGGLLLLHPMPGAVDQVAADHPGAGAFLHGFEIARPLIGAPIAPAGDEHRRHVDPASGKEPQFGIGEPRSAAAVPIEP